MEFPSNYKEISLSTWKRSALFKSFLTFHDPCFVMSVEVNALPLKKFAAARGESFFLRTLFEISRAYNSVPEMRQRFLNDHAIAEYEVCHPSVPLITADGESFHQTMLCYYPTFAEFSANALPIVEAIRCGNVSGQALEDSVPNCFCASCVPWVSAAGYVPATYECNQDIHVLTWFKMTPAGTVLINNRFNHCFTDGIHAARFFNAIAENFAAPQI